MSRSSGLRRLLVLDLVNDDRLELGVDLERMRVVFRDRQLHLTLLLLTAIDQEGAEADEVPRAMRADRAGVGRTWSE